METLNQYFSYNNDIEKARDIFLSLDNQLKLIHNRGYSVEINSSSIVYENGFSFSKFNYGLSEEERLSNIQDLCKLAVGTYFSLPSGTFCDYTHLPNEYIYENFDVMESSILKATANDSYYREILVNNKCIYYNDYLKELSKNNNGKGNTNGRVLSYYTPQGQAMTNKDEAAFIELAFYPIIVTLSIIMLYVVYILMG